MCYYVGRIPMNYFYLNKDNFKDFIRRRYKNEPYEIISENSDYIEIMFKSKNKTDKFWFNRYY